MKNTPTGPDIPSVLELLAKAGHFVDHAEELEMLSAVADEIEARHATMSTRALAAEACGEVDHLTRDLARAEIRRRLLTPAARPTMPHGHAPRRPRLHRARSSLAAGDEPDDADDNGHLVTRRGAYEGAFFVSEEVS